MQQAEVHAAAIFQQLGTDPRLSLLPTPGLPLFRTIVLLLVRTRLPWTLLLMLLSPRTVDARLLRLVSMLHAAGKVEADATASTYLAAVQRLFVDATPRLLRAASPAMLGAMQTFALAGRLLGDLATESELQAVLRGAPSNPTTEMALSLACAKCHVLHQLAAGESAGASLACGRGTGTSRTAGARRRHVLHHAARSAQRAGRSRSAFPRQRPARHLRAGTGSPPGAARPPLRWHRAVCQTTHR